MASTQSWQEWNAPAATYTATASRTDANWKNLDDSTTAYSASPITAPVSGSNYSFAKHQGLVFAGTWNSLSALTYKVSNNSPGTGLSVVASVLAALPTVSDAGAPNSNLTDGDAAASTTGSAANFTGSTNTTAAIYAAGSTTASGGGTNYAQVYRSQLVVASTAGPGDVTTPVTITATWTES
jgi:hypothetical protein